MDLETMNQEQLLALRAEIDEKLTGITLIEVNLVQEALIQLKKAKILQLRASIPRSGIPMNQQAQVQNSISKILNDLGKLQIKLFDSEQRKRIQAATIKAVKLLPPEAQEKFFELYEPILAEAEKVMFEIQAEEELAPLEDEAYVPDEE